MNHHVLDFPEVGGKLLRNENVSGVQVSLWSFGVKDLVICAASPARTVQTRSKVLGTNCKCVPLSWHEPITFISLQILYLWMICGKLDIDLISWYISFQLQYTTTLSAQHKTCGDGLILWRCQELTPSYCTCDLLPNSIWLQVKYYWSSSYIQQLSL